MVADLVARANKVKSEEEIGQVGTISANGDLDVGTMISEAMQKVGKEGVIGSGWASKFYPQARGELYFVLDQGYATGDQNIEVNPKHFPEFGNSSSDPAKRLVQFQTRIQKLGWRGLGLWTRVTKPSDAAKFAAWSKEANIKSRRHCCAKKKLLQSS